MTIIQAAVLGITAVALAVQLKPLRQEYSVYLILAAGLVIGFLSISRLELILDTVRAIGSQIRVKNIYLGTLLKMVGITYIAEFASGICRDAGFSALGTQVEMFGKLSILAVSAPVLQALLETLQVFLSEEGPAFFSGPGPFPVHVFRPGPGGGGSGGALCPGGF